MKRWKTRSALFLRGMATRLMAAVAVVLIVSGFTLSGGQKSKLLAGDGVTTQGEIVGLGSLYLPNRGTRFGNNTSSTYHMDVRFMVNGQRVQARDTTSRRFYQSKGYGDIVEVTYLPADPTIIELEPGALHVEPALETAVQVVCLIVMGVLGLFGWHTAGRQAAVCDTGVPRRAEVLGHVSAVGGLYWRLIWRDSAGIAGRSLAHRRQFIAAFPPGQEINVYADHAGHLPSVWDRDVRLPRVDKTDPPD